MSTTMIRARVRDECVGEIEDAARTMFAAIHQAGPTGVKYASSRIGDSNTFLVILDYEGEENPLAAIPEFGEFQARLGGWLAEPPAVEQLKVLGSYGLF